MGKEKRLKAICHHWGTTITSVEIHWVVKVDEHDLLLLTDKEDIIVIKVTVAKDDLVAVILQNGTANKGHTLGEIILQNVPQSGRLQWSLQLAALQRLDQLLIEPTAEDVLHPFLVEIARNGHLEGVKVRQPPGDAPPQRHTVVVLGRQRPPLQVRHHQRIRPNLVDGRTETGLADGEVRQVGGGHREELKLIVHNEIVELDD